VLGTTSSEAVLPRMITKMENVGCAKPVVGLVIPLIMAAILVAQATNVPLVLGQQLSILGVSPLTCKGVAAVTGGGFISLAATLLTTGKVPVAQLAMLLGIDRFMSEARAITNLIGDGVATIVVARWEGALDLRRAQSVLAATTEALTDEPEAVAGISDEPAYRLPETEDREARGSVLGKADHADPVIPS
jgi:aerobic C4-dicarboxylate transport protein